MILGIDIGVTGGIAVLSAFGELIEVHAMPCLADGHAGRRAVNGPLLASIVFAKGVLAAADIPATFLTPPTWKRAVGLPPGRDKDASRAAAIQRWPAKADLFKLKKSDGVAEVALIAVAGLVRGRAP